MKIKIEEKVAIPEGAEAKLEGFKFIAKGKKGEISRIFRSPGVKIEIKGKEIVILSEKATKREKRMIGTFKSHIFNMVRGVVDGHKYRLKMCSSHFPMTAQINKGEFIVQNFLGEQVPRKIKMLPGVNVKIEGQEISVESADKELAGQTAASIEQLCRITNRDRRVFQDGIYIILKSEKER